MFLPIDNYWIILILDQNKNNEIYKGNKMALPNKEIADTAYNQMNTHSYAHLFLDKSSDIAVKLAEQLTEIVQGVC